MATNKVKKSGVKEQVKEEKPKTKTKTKSAKPAAVAAVAAVAAPVKVKKKRAAKASATAIISAISLGKGRPDLNARLAELSPSKNVLRRALKLTRDAENEEFSDILLDFAATRGFFLDGAKGRSAPQLGDHRVYRVQQLKMGPPFVRLSCETLGLTKGSLVHVSFLDGETVLTPASRGAVAVDEDDITGVHYDDELDDDEQGASAAA